MTPADRWMQDTLDDLEAEQLRVTAMAEKETDTYIAAAFRDRLGQIRQQLKDLTK